MSKTKKPYIWLSLWVAIGIGAGILIGNVFAPLSNASQGKLFGRNSKLDKVFAAISKAYVDTVNVDDLVEKAVPSVISGLDPHSAYISAEEMALNGEVLDGHFSGIGVEFMIHNDTIAIIRVIPGGPSEAVGISPGDRIVYVDDSLFVGKEISNDKVFRKLRGVKDSKVKLGIKKSLVPDTLSITVTRADVPVKSINAAFEIDNKIGYIKISQFASTTYNEFISAMAKLKRQGCESFIIDLQQNGGGYLGAPKQLANEFLSAGQLIFYTEGRAYAREDVFADGTGTFKTDQLVILMDEISASASEVFSGAMQDNDRALIIGRRSFGKGLVQYPYKFDDGSVLRLTIARYHTPSGRCVQKQYEQGNSSEYNQDLKNRYMRGEFDNKDSMKVDNLPLFETLSGRPVYGNDGIMPDIFVPRDTTGQNSYYIRVVNSGLLHEFAFMYSDNNRKLFKGKTPEEAAKYLATQSLVYQLTVHAESKGVRRRPQLIAESNRLLQKQIESVILRNLYGEEAFYPVFMRDDILIKKAVEAIKGGKASVEAIIEKRYL